MDSIINPFSITDKIENRSDTFTGSSFSLLQWHVSWEQYEHLESWENPYWMEKQLDQHENQINLDTDGKDKC